MQMLLHEQSSVRTHPEKDEKKQTNKRKRQKNTHTQIPPTHAHAQKSYGNMQKNILSQFCI